MVKETDSGFFASIFRTAGRVGLKIKIHEIHEIHQNLRNPVSISRPIVSATCLNHSVTSAADIIRPRPNPKTGVPANLNQTHFNLLTIDCLIYF